MTAYVGIDGKARKIGSAYIGVDGVARKVTKAYVGVDGVAQLWWVLDEGGGPVVLEVEKVTATTYAGETTYTGEQFILLDIYPKTNGTVYVTYGGLTKTITDTSGAAKPNAQKVFFGTFNGVSDSAATPASGTLTIEGDYYAFGQGSFDPGSKVSGKYCPCVAAILEFGDVEQIPNNAFDCSSPDTVASITYFVALAGDVIIPDTVKTIGSAAFLKSKISSVTILSNVTRIGFSAFSGCELLKTVSILATVPPTLEPRSDGIYSQFMDNTNSDAVYLEKIVVPKGCGSAYKSDGMWSTYADYIVEAS